MKLFKVEIENYRQYNGKISLDFSTSDKNITIIQGDNGGGKSNFMNAIVWCLFEDEMFKSKNNEGRLIINEAAIESASTNEDVMASVSVILGDEKPEFEFIRSMEFFKTPSGRIDYRTPEFKGYHITSAGHSVIGDPNWEVSKQFIPKDLRSFFFFDGEKMDQYFEDTSSVKENVERISQIDVLNDVISTLQATIRAIERDMGKLSPESEELSEELQRYQISKIELESKIRDLVPQINDYEEEKNNIDDYLRNNSSELVRSKAKLRDGLREQYSQVSNQLNAVKNEIRHLVADSIPGVYAYAALKYAAKLIEEETNKGSLPPNVKDVFLKELLEKGICICGRSIDEGNCRNNIQNLLDSIVPSDIAYDATQGKYAINSIISKIDFRPKLISKLQSRIELESKLKDLDEELEKISLELSNFDENKIVELEKRRTSLETKCFNAIQSKGNFEGQLLRLEGDISNLEDMLAQSNKDYKKYLYYEKQKNYAIQLLENFKTIKEQIIREVRVRLESKTREYFFNMIWKKKAFSDVRIVDLGNKYKISVLSSNNAECLGDLSAGERQVLALSFTAALYSVSGYSVPVIIDTPLGRISGTTRDNIASSLPNYLSETQLIMTMTDTEYTESVREAMKAAVGAEYKIQYDEDSKNSKVVIM